MKDELDLIRESQEWARSEMKSLRTQLAETQRDRQREHDLRVRLAGEVESLREALENLVDNIVRGFVGRDSPAANRARAALAAGRE